MRTNIYQPIPNKEIVEILSPSTSKKDRLLKHQIYEQQGVLYYLIADPIKKKVEIYLLRENKYQKIAETGNSKVDFELKDCKISLDFSVIWM